MQKIANRHGVILFPVCSKMETTENRLLKEFINTHITPSDGSDELAKEILMQEGFSPNDLNISFNNDKFVGLSGDRGNDIGVVILSGGEYDNPEMIDFDTMRDISQTAYKDAHIYLYTNCGVEVGSKHPPEFMKNVSIIKIPTYLKQSSSIAQTPTCSKMELVENPTCRKYRQVDSTDGKMIVSGGINFSALNIGDTFHTGKSMGIGIRSNVEMWQEFEKISKSQARCIATPGYDNDRHVGTVANFAPNKWVYPTCRKYRQVDSTVKKSLIVAKRIIIAEAQKKTEDGNAEYTVIDQDTQNEIGQMTLEDITKILTQNQVAVFKKGCRKFVIQKTAIQNYIEDPIEPFEGYKPFHSRTFTMELSSMIGPTPIFLGLFSYDEAIKMQQVHEQTEDIVPVELGYEMKKKRKASINKKSDRLHTFANINKQAVSDQEGQASIRKWIEVDDYEYDGKVQDILKSNITTEEKIEAIGNRVAEILVERDIYQDLEDVNNLSVEYTSWNPPKIDFDEIEKFVVGWEEDQLL